MSRISRIGRSGRSWLLDACERDLISATLAAGPEPPDPGDPRVLDWIETFEPVGADIERDLAQLWGSTRR